MNKATVYGEVVIKPVAVDRLTLEEAAKYLRMGKSTLYRAVRANLISCIKPPVGPLQFKLSVLNEYLANSEIPAGTIGNNRRRA